MAVTNLKDSGNWLHGTFTAQVGTDFDTYKAILEYTAQDEIFSGNGKPTLDPAVKKILAQAGDPEGPLPTYYSKRKCRDSSLGGNDAINPLPQFCEDDDISHPHLYSDKTGSISMGQVYSENYDDLQQILYMGFGIPVYTDMSSFWSAAIDSDLAGYVNKGTGITVEKIGRLIGAAPIALFRVATIPFKFIGAIYDTLQNVPINKYYSFSSQMTMYFRYVNTIMVMLATNMNMAGSNDNLPGTSSSSSGKTPVELLEEGYNQKQDLDGSSTLFREHGLDMARIMLKKFYYENGNRETHKSRWTDTALFESANLDNGQGTVSTGDASTPTTSTSNETNSGGLPDGAPSLKYWTLNWFDNFAAGTKTAIFDGHLFIGFRIDKGLGGSESFSNSSGESKISQFVNQKFQESRETSFHSMGGDVDKSIAEEAITMAKSMMSGAADALSMDALAAAATGAARIDIPEVWQSSSYSRTQSFTITCLSPYGDFQSIFQSEYVPLACILAGTLPRGTGHSSYSSPFVCQAYCRGVFASPLCMIESVQVTRGADQFGMNAARLPLKLTMNITLKDLSPSMYMTMGGDRGIVSSIMGNEDTFSEYMMTLSGMGLADRLKPWKNMRRRVQILLSTTFKNKLNPHMLGMDMGSRWSASRLISSFISGGRNLPSN